MWITPLGQRTLGDSELRLWISGVSEYYNQFCEEQPISIRKESVSVIGVPYLLGQVAGVSEKQKKKY